jgi:hypothetical protein
MNTKRIARLHPTQMTHGEREIRQKADAYRALSEHDLDMAIAEKPIPVVLGPGGEPYVIDHHHVACALERIGVKDVPFVLVRDLTSLSQPEFWLTLENNSWVHPYDADGRRIAFKDIPTQMGDAVNDEFRSLAAFVREAGGYEKTDVPLADFPLDRLLSRALFATERRCGIRRARSAWERSGPQRCGRGPAWFHRLKPSASVRMRRNEVLHRYIDRLGRDAVVQHDAVGPSPVGGSS